MGLLPACRTLDTISVFALTVADAYEVFRTAAGFDPADAFARDIGAPALVKPKASPRIGIPSAESVRFEGDELQKASFNEAISTLEDAGAEISEIDFSPLFAIAEMLYAGCWVAERYVATESLLKTNPDGMFPVTRKIIESAESKTAADAFRDFYRLKEVSSSITPVLEQYDALCIPTIPTLATVADLEADAVGPNNMLGTYTNFVNLMDMCGSPFQQRREQTAALAALRSWPRPVPMPKQQLLRRSWRPHRRARWVRPGGPRKASHCPNSLPRTCSGSPFAALTCWGCR